ncbi:MAG: twin-arginine translocation signal domain-containing protein, partial [Candidatus Rokubacteria bacterium]|nr:twin-arginine translocation signal domain-containing protein [Candidatus Rokubacteria bacterium]
MNESTASPVAEIPQTESRRGFLKKAAVAAGAAAAATVGVP